MVHTAPAAIDTSARPPTAYATSGQEPLRQVAGVFRVETSAADTAVERIPTRLAERRERFTRGLRVVPASRQHETPPRCFEAQDDALYARWSPLAI